MDNKCRRITYFAIATNDAFEDVFCRFAHQICSGMRKRRGLSAHPVKSCQGARFDWSVWIEMPA